jgi:hypothetical protein
VVVLHRGTVVVNCPSSQVTEARIVTEVSR